MSANGKPATISRAKLQQARREVRYLEAELQIKQLARQKKLIESHTSDLWVDVVRARIERYQSDYDMTAASYGDRRHGQNAPIFRSEQDLALFRMQSRLVCATNSYAQGLVEGLTSYIIGTGFTYRAVVKKGVSQTAAPEELIDAVQWVIDNFLERNSWQGGEYYSLEEELFWRSWEDGEFFLIHHEDKDTGAVTVRTVEPEQVTLPALDGPVDEREWKFGVHTDPDDIQVPLGYWIYYGDFPAEGKEYPAEQVTHFKGNTKRSIKRGVPGFIFDTYDAFHHASQLRKNMMVGAAIQAAISYVRQHKGMTKAQVTDFASALKDYETTNPHTGATEYNRVHKPGGLDVPEGQEFVQPPTAQNAAAHVEILQAGLRAAGVRWNAPEWVSSADSSNNNFASGLVAESPFVRTGTRKQKAYGSAFRRSVLIALEKWIGKNGLHVKVPVSAGSTTLAERSYTWEEIRKLIDVQVEGPSLEARNKLEESQRMQIEVMNKVASVQTWQQKLDYDTDREMTNMEEFAERMGPQASGLPMPGDQQQTGQQAPELPSLAPATPESVQESVERDTPEVRLLSLAAAYWREVTEGRLEECGGEGGKPGPCPEPGESTHSGKSSTQIDSTHKEPWQMSRWCESKGYACPYREEEIALALGLTRPVELLESAKLERCVADVKKKGKADSAWAVCKASLGECTVEECQCAKCRELREARIIDLPDERQDTAYSCGAAATVSVCKYFGIEPDTESEAITQLGTSPAAGTPPDRIVEVLQAHGLTVEHHDWFDLDGIKRKHLDAGHPVICPVQMYGDPEEYGRADSGHYVVLIGYEGETLLLQDPVSGRVRMEEDEFKRRWFDKEEDGTPYERYGIAVWKPELNAVEAAGTCKPGERADLTGCSPATKDSAGGSLASTEEPKRFPTSPLQIREYMDANKPKLSPSQKSAMLGYQQDKRYMELNSDLRSGKAREGDKELDGAIHGNKTSSALVAFRGISDLKVFGNDPPDKLIGKTFADAAYMSTSLNEMVGEQFDGAAIFELTIPKGTSALMMPVHREFGDESEVLLPRSSRFKIVSATKEGKTWRIKAELA